MTWGTVAAVAAVCVALRVASPLLLGARGLPPAVARALDALVVPLLAGLVLFQLLGNGQVDARAGGVAAAAGAFLYRRSLVVALVAAAAVTALLRHA